jgi:A/G-specific adenine glycosylase
MTLQNAVIDWYIKNGRLFSWRNIELDGWRWLVLEMLLRKTRAETVDNNFALFINKYNSPAILYSTYIGELENDLRCFGLYRQRREAFMSITETIVKEYDGSTDEFLFNCPIEKMKHIGHYTYNATLCFCFNIKKPIVDVNIARIITRYYGLDMPTDLRKAWIWRLAEDLLPFNQYVEYNYGMLDIGAIFCKNNPLCEGCPLIGRCEYADTNSI